jgi:hypothetical protein
MSGFVLKTRCDTHRRTLHATVSFRSLQGHAKSSVPLSSRYRPPIKGMRREKEREERRDERERERREDIEYDIE